MIKSKRQRLVLAAVFVFVVALLFWNTHKGPRASAAAVSKSSSVSDSKEKLASKADSNAVDAAQQGEVAKIEFPFTGKINVRTRSETVVWKDPMGKAHEFPFKFYCTETGVWVRAEYRGPGEQHEDSALRELEGLQKSQG